MKKVYLALTVLIFASLMVSEEKYNKVFPFIKYVEYKLLDYKFLLRGAIKAPQSVVIVAIDERSIRKFGRWPFNRKLIGKALDGIISQKPSVLGLNITFSEVEALESDAYLSNVLKKLDKTVLGYFLYYDKSINHLTPYQIESIKASAIKAALGPNIPIPRSIPIAAEIAPNIDVLSKNITNQAFLDVSLDIDGALRHSHLIAQYNNSFFPSFALKCAELYTRNTLILHYSEFGLEKLQMDKLLIPVDLSGQLLINYYGPYGSFSHISFSDVLENPGKYELKGKIVLFGVVAKGISAFKVAPFQKDLPDIEVNANIISNIITSNFLEPLNVVITVIVSLLLLLTLALITTKRSSLQTTSAYLTVIVCYNLVDLALFTKNVYMKSLLPNLMFITHFLFLIIHKYFIEERQKRFIKSAFKHYLAPSVVDRIADDPSILKLGGDKKNLTVLFSDIRNFTTLSEKMQPTQLTQHLNYYLTSMTKIILDNNGTLDKYIGDAIMAIYGAPVEVVNHPEMACKTAVSMIQALDSFKNNPTIQYFKDINIGIGINTGPMVIGNMGSSNIFNYTVIGDAVNLSSRLESLNKLYGTNIIVSEFTHDYVKNTFSFRKLDRITVKGKAEPVTVYELIARRANAEIVGQYESALDLYFKSNWLEAIKVFKTINDAASKVFVSRCEDLIKNPRSNWDGVYHLDKK